MTKREMSSKFRRALEGLSKQPSTYLERTEGWMDRLKPLPRVLVCGGRNFEDELLLAVTMESIRETRGISMVIGGGSRGADTMAEEWAKSRAIECVVFDVDWVGLGRAAGPIRNQQMFDEGKPNLVVAVPGGRVTADMARKARAAGVEVIEVGG